MLCRRFFILQTHKSKSSGPIWPPQRKKTEGVDARHEASHAARASDAEDWWDCEERESE